MNLAATIQQRIAGMLPELLGMQFTEVTPEHAVATLLVRPDLCTAGGILHGGTIMAFADTLGAVATVVNLPEGARTVTIESKTNFVGSAPAGSTVLGEATAVHKGHTTMVWQTHVRSSAGKLVALVTQTQMVIRP